MSLLSLVWNIFAFVIMTTFEMVANVADEIMFTLEDNDVYGKIFKSLSFCIGNFYFWQALATIGFCHSLRRLANNFPAPPIVTIDSPVDAGPSMEQLLEEKESALTDAASQIDNLDRENAGLRAKVGFLESEVDFLSKDRYTLIREKFTLQNKLGDFNSWPEFRVEFDELTAEFIAMERQRAREHLLQERTLEIAKETRAELAAAKWAKTMSKIAHSEELELVKKERDDAMEKYRILLATTTTATTAVANPATTTAPTVTAAAVTATTSPVVNAAAAVITASKGKSPGDIALQDENNRLTLALRSQSSLLAKKSSDLGRMQSLLKTRSDHSALQLRTATSTITSLEEDKGKAEARIAELERDLQEANGKAEEMEEMYMAVAFASEGEGGTEEKEEKGADEEEGSGGENAETSWLLRQIVEMSKKGPAGGSGADGSEDDDEEEEDDDDDDDDDDDGEGEEGGEEKTIHDENEQLLKDMMGIP